MSNYCPEDDDYNNKCEENFLFHVKGSKATYRVFSHSGICTAAQASQYTWSYQDNTQYWELNVIKNNIFGSKVYKCTNVWWFNPQLVVEKIPSGVFHVYLRHGGQHIPSGEFKVYRIFADGKEEQIKVDSTPRPFDHRFDFQSGILQNTYACTIDASDFEGETVDLKFELFQSSNCVYDYLIEGVILVPVNDLDTPPLQYFKIAQDKDLKINWEERAPGIKIVKVESGKEVEVLEEEDDDEPIESFDKVKLDDVQPVYREKILALFAEIWLKYDADNNNYLTEDEFINLMADIYERLETPYDRDNIITMFQRSDRRQTGQLFRQDIVWLIQQTAGILEQKTIREELRLKEIEKEKKREVQDAEMKDLLKKYNNNCIPLSGQVQSETDGTEHEGPENLLTPDEDGSKWCVTGSGNGTVVFELDEDIEFNLFGLKSANDCPHRDPLIVRLYQLGLPEDEDGVGIEIFEREKLSYGGRHKTTIFRLDQTIKGSMFKIYLESGSSELQLCQIIFAKLDE